VITVSTVGFQEVHPLTDAGRLFTSLLILSSIGAFAYGISAITTYFVAGEYRDTIRLTRIQTKMDKLEDHVIICGFGRVGRQAVQEIQAYGQPFVVIETKEFDIRQVEHPEEVIFHRGDATQDEVLMEAGIERAKALITTLPNDADNLYVVLTAREIKSDLKIISRASKPQSVKKLRIAGADNIIMPDSVGGAHMASLVVTPDVMEFLDHISIQGSADINLEEVCFTDLPEGFGAMTLGELMERNVFGVNIIGLKNKEGEFIINPGPSTPLTSHSKFFVLGKPEQIKRLNRVMQIKT
ncbi:MAG: potassium channel protein, partial [Flavobacteriales bacterium]|nr:potassium channel protein [Flavobacteriales bacterium]